jgi:hypothetical protein
MPVHYCIDDNRRLVHTVCEGDLVYADVTAYFQALGSDPAFVDQLNLLLELRADNVLTPREVFGMVEPMRNAFGNRRFNRVAIVTFTDSWYRYARKFDATSTGFFAEPRMFRELDTALAWLVPS